MKKTFKQKFADYINSLSDELRAVIDHKKNKPRTPKLGKLGKFAIILCSVIYLLIGCFGGVKSSAAEPSSTTPSDLTGYTVTVPADWSAMVGYGQFDVNFTISGDENAGDREYNHLGIGFAYNEYDDYFNLADSVIYYDNLGYISSTFSGLSFSISFLGGADASKPSLIQWLADNNATFVNNNESDPDPDPDPDPNPTTTFHKGLYRVSSTWYESTIGTRLDGFQFYTLDEGVLFDSINVWNNQQLIAYTADGEMITAAGFTNTGFDWFDRSFQFLYFINDETISESFAAEVPSLLEYIPGVTLDEFLCMQDSWYYGVLDGYDGSQKDYDSGYEAGYAAGAADTVGDNFMSDFFGGIVRALDALTLFGDISMLNIIEAILGLLLALWILKLIAGG